MTVIVTGANGFIGRHVARALATRGTAVVGIGHGTWTRDEWRRWGLDEWHPADVSIESLLTYGGAPDAIFHCAGSGSVGFSMTHPYQDWQRTVSTTLSVLEFVRLYARRAKVVMPSSAGVYGNTVHMPISVNSRLDPASPYGQHKKVAEELCRSYCKNFQVSCAVVRLFSVYGIGLRKQLIWDACRKILASDTTFAGTGAETRDWLHVEDAAELLILGAEQASPDCPVANGGVGKAVPIRAMLETIADRFDNKAQLAFSGISRPGDPIHYLADITEATAWGWKPLRDWHQEIPAYVDWFQKGAP